MSADRSCFRRGAKEVVRRFSLCILLFGVAVVLSCGGVTGSGNNGPSGGTPQPPSNPQPPSGGGGTPATAPGFVYVANTNSNNVTGLKVDTSSNAVTAVATSPFTVANFPVNIATTADFVFAASSGDQFGTNPANYRITTFKADSSTGNLAQSAALTYPASVGQGAPVELRIDPTGKFLYVVLGGAGGFASFSIDPTSGALTELAGSPQQPVGFGVLRHPVITPDGKTTYMTGDIGPRAPAYEITRFIRDSVTGKIDPNFGSTPADGLIESMAITPNGKFLLAVVPQKPVANTGQLGPLNSVSVYAIAVDGSLTAVPNEPFAVGTGPQAVAVDPTSKFAIVANRDANNVSVLSIAADGTLAPVAGSPFMAGTRPVAVAVSASGKYVFVANAGSNDMSGYLLDAPTGKLTPLGAPSPAGSAPVGVVTVGF